MMRWRRSAIAWAFDPLALVVGALATVQFHRNVANANAPTPFNIADLIWFARGRDRGDPAWPVRSGRRRDRDVEKLPNAPYRLLKRLSTVSDRRGKRGDTRPVLPEYSVQS